MILFVLHYFAEMKFRQARDTLRKTPTMLSSVFRDGFVPF